MHTLRVNVQDSVFDKVVYFLKNLPKNEVEIIEETAVGATNKEADFIEHLVHNPVSLNATSGFLSREEANQR